MRALAATPAFSNDLDGNLGFDAKCNLTKGLTPPPPMRVGKSTPETLGDSCSDGLDLAPMRDDDDIDLLESREEKQDDKEGDKKAEKKRLKKLEESLETGVLEPRERYRALTDLLEMNNDISEMADKKTRFALVILGAVNAINLFLVARPEIVLGGRQAHPGWMGAYLTTYIVLSLYVFIQAIGALRPRVTSLMKRIGEADGAGHKLLGLRFLSNIMDASIEKYYQKWREANWGDVNREVALAVKVVAEVLNEKYAAIHRMYTGLLILVLLSAGLIAVLGIVRVTS